MGFCGIHNDSIYHGTLYWLRCAMAEEDFTFCGFGSLTALHSMWVANYLVLFDAYGVFSFTYVMNFIVIIDLTRCCFLHYGALALFG